MELKKEDQSMDASILHRRENNIITRGRGKEGERRGREKKGELDQVWKVQERSTKDQEI